ncbi:hypothetical protein K402DRAFT_458907 [Aulographum hederae CBS 113979]|uniref:BTB domain-containing protein n=1 Tax=Aulographum hederae CBS 113979 TaxID=1176131 RepID=A0A6G1HHL5_9PEZI|nr:hypothetical protein K402DRAFT_458907 [Aulographum hederae CBS 113979]
MSKTNLETFSKGSAIIDPDGDLRLLVGQDKAQKDILVSSKVLLLVSDVFRKMLPELFGSEGSKPSTDEIRTFLDDVILPVVEVAEKYNCLRAIAPWVRTNLPRSRAGDQGFEAVLYVAYIMDGVRAFQQSSREYLLKLGSERSVHDYPFSEYFPKKFHKNFQKHRIHLLTRIEEEIQRLMVDTFGD